jgi:AcrR family transcriptional regulator
MSVDRDELAEKRRREVLDAAESLLAVHGYETLRLRDVSQAAGVSVGLIQHYFGTRDELLLETMRVASERRVEQWGRLAKGARSPMERLRSLIDGAIGDRHRCVVWVETCAAATRHDALKGDVLKTQQAWLDTLIEVLEDGTEDGSFPDVTSVTDTAELLVRVIDGFMLDAALADSDPPDDAGHRRRVALLRRAATHIVGV